MTSQLERLREVMASLRRECPWDAKQTHASLVKHLVEETCEVVDAIEDGDDADLVEELGDVLLQVYFHSQIATDEGRFTLDDVARGVGDKLIRRHPHVFAGASQPEDVHKVWEEIKRAEKQRTSVLDGVAESMSSVARAHKAISRARADHLAVDLPTAHVSAEEVGAQVLDLVARAQASGVDADAAIRDAVRTLESEIREAEDRSRPGRVNTDPVV